jgi:2-iminobutanoate/2-iminopropanoate deaminase
MEKKIVETEKAPKPIGPYSQAVWCGDMLYLSGQIAINPETGDLVLDTITAETQQVMENIKAVLNAANLRMGNIIKTTIFLKNMDDFTAVNEVYGKFFTSDFPARETVQVAKLPKDVNVEISVIASK